MTPRRAVRSPSGASARTTRLILALLLASLLMVIYSDFGARGILAGLTASVATVPLYVGLVLWLDRHEPEPHALLAWAFFWGASGAAFLSFLANTLFVTTAAAFHPYLPGLLSGAFIAPFAEELSKGALLLAFFHWYPEEFDNVTDGIVYAAMVGLGFAATENVLYYAAAFVAGADAFREIWLIRGVASPFAHPLFTAALGLALGIARERAASPTGQAAAAAFGLTGAVLLHASWNVAAIIGFMEAFYLSSMVPVMLGFALLLRRSLAREAEVIRRELAPYVRTGVLEQDRLEELVDRRGRLRASVVAFFNGGITAVRADARLRQTAAELAFHHWRSSRGIAQDAAEIDRASTLQRLLLESRPSAVGRHGPRLAPPAAARTGSSDG